MTDLRSNLSGSGVSYARYIDGALLERLSPSGFALAVPAKIFRINDVDGMKPFGTLPGGATTGVVAVHAGSGTVFGISPAATVGQQFALQGSALDRSLVLMQNRSAATQAVYSVGVTSGLTAYLNPSGAAWFRFSTASGGWELHGRTQMGF